MGHDLTAQAAQAGVSPELSVRRGREAVEFYQAAFGAVEVYRVGGTDEHEAVVSQPLVEWPPSHASHAAPEGS